MSVGNQFEMFIFIYKSNLSAGIGRTGTFIAIDCLWQQIDKEFLQPQMSRKNAWQEFFAKSNQILLNQRQLDNKTEPDLSSNSGTASNAKTTAYQGTKSFDGLKLPKKRKFRTVAEFLRLPSTYEKNCKLININNHRQMSNLNLDNYMIDVNGCVYHMRGYRMGMVQTEVF